MSGWLVALAVVVWLAAVYGFVRVVMAWLGVMGVAPSGQKLATAWDLGFWNFPAVEQRIGAGAGSHIKAYRQGFLVFFGAIAIFMIITVANIIAGNAA